MPDLPRDPTPHHLSLRPPHATGSAGERLTRGSIIAPKLSAKEIVEGGTLSGSFDYAGVVPGKLPKKVGDVEGFQAGKTYEEHSQQESLQKVQAASQDLHDLLGKAHPHKAPKTQSAMALLSKKAPPSN